MNRSKSRNTLVAILLAGLLVLGLAACGDDSEDGSSSGPSGGESADVRAVEKAFLTGMAHHHESAISMAEIAKEKGEDPFVTKLGDDIVSTQEREIGEMKKIYGRLLGGELKPDPGAHDGLGLSAEEAGMTHSEETNEMLRAASPFDRAFVDEMVPHHTGAVKMAEVVLKSTQDSELRGLAEAIALTQSREIQEMNAFRSENYGGPVPEEQPGEEHGGGHG